MERSFLSLSIHLISSFSSTEILSKSQELVRVPCLALNLDAQIDRFSHLRAHAHHVGKTLFQIQPEASLGLVNVKIQVVAHIIGVILVASEKLKMLHDVSLLPTFVESQKVYYTSEACSADFAF